MLRHNVEFESFKSNFEATDNYPGAMSFGHCWQMLPALFLINRQWAYCILPKIIKQVIHYFFLSHTLKNIGPQLEHQKALLMYFVYDIGKDIQRQIIDITQHFFCWCHWLFLIWSPGNWPWLALQRIWIDISKYWSIYTG